MTKEEKIANIRIMLGEDSLSYTDEVVTLYLNLATKKCLDRLFPFGDGYENLPPKYDCEVIELAVRYMNRIGAEGETGHSENGIVRTYGSVDDSDILNRIVPRAKLC